MSHNYKALWQMKDQVHILISPVQSQVAVTAGITGWSAAHTHACS